MCLLPVPHCLNGDPRRAGASSCVHGCVPMPTPVMLQGLDFILWVLENHWRCWPGVGWGHMSDRGVGKSSVNVTSSWWQVRKEAPWCIRSAREGSCDPAPRLPWMGPSFAALVNYQLVVLVVKNSPASAGSLRDVGSIPESGSPEGGNGNPLQYSCLENPWIEEPGRLQSLGSQRVGRNWSIDLIL